MGTFHNPGSAACVPRFRCVSRWVWSPPVKAAHRGDLSVWTLNLAYRFMLRSVGCKPENSYSSLACFLDQSAALVPGMRALPSLLRRRVESAQEGGASECI